MLATGRSGGSPEWAKPALALHALPFASHCIHHLIWPGFRRGVGSSGSVPKRVRIAAYDAVIGLLLDGYSQLAGHPLRPQTGALIVRLNRLIGAVDEEYEHRLAGQLSLAFGAVFAAGAVQDRLTELAGFLRPYPERLAIRDFLLDRVSQHYSTYVELTESGKAERGPDWHLHSALLDSAGVAECLAHVIGLFHCMPPHNGIVGQFSCFGMLGKVADDVIDFWDDLATDRANILHGIVLRHPAEQQKVQRIAEERALSGAESAGRRERTGLRWWRENCPESYSEAATLIDGHRSRLTSPRLRLAADLVLVPAWHGRIATSGATVGLRQ